MSMIFQSLQKLDLLLNSESVDAHGGAATSPARSAPDWNRMRPIVIGLVLVLVLGCGAVYAVAYLGDRAGMESSSPAVRSRPVPDAHESSPSVAGPSSARTPDAVSRDPSAPEEDHGASPAQVRFYPPEDSSAPEKIVSEPASRQPAASDVPSPANVEQDSLLLTASVKKPPSTGILEKQREAKALGNDQVDEAALKAIEVRRRAVLEKSARIGRLVRRIEAAMAKGEDRRRIETLLDELAHIKGPEHPYVVKLRACWLFKQGAYDSAALEFEKVLSADQQDREAGINMALIEVHRGQAAKAITRLKRLLDVYPDNTLIADLIERLR